MKHFSLPADFRKSTIDRYGQLNQKYHSSARVIETYGQMTMGESIFNSARKVGELNQVDLVYLADYIAYSRERGIGFSYTLNATCNNNLEFTKTGMESMLNTLKNLYEAGVRSVTITLPSVLEIVKNSGYAFKLKASTLCRINSANMANFYKHHGFERIVVEEDITRDFRKLRQITQAFGEGVEVIVNDTCFTDCPYKNFHFNYTAHTASENEQTVNNYYVNRCHMQKINDPKNYLHLNWIRPEDLKYYQAVGIYHYKIQGRQFVQQGDPIRVLEAYINESFDGDLHDLLNLFVKYNAFSPVIDNKKLDGFIERFYNHPESCSRNCELCNYCAEWAEKSIDYEYTRTVMQNGRKFLQESDSFLQLIEENKKKQVNQDSGFDF